ncbi:hypothetical protein BX659_14519 [Orenia metallireducens]|uniref:Uncharacterized protein n=1 Tax=Orenia metallireducens TaxID=1413210 RepID=A0A285IGN6_9FIRM|nr:hypothetical protein [Orenia metallireducens]PRX18143.1 hypothetical protein BX659_14519 [Orenia metallireducens]SNY46947.1 hypothetical protein SAMN06265827_14619 [Orenia metallireducens]
MSEVKNQKKNLREIQLSTAELEEITGGFSTSFSETDMAEAYMLMAYAIMLPEDMKLAIAKLRSKTDG